MTSSNCDVTPATQISRGRLVAKRIFDFVSAALGVIVLSPLLVLAAIAVRVLSRGPIFYCQERVGRNFRPFRIIKFRTMVRDADRQGALITAGRDPRITSVGRFLRKSKIDELPQLFNVLKGDMSLVGPRPEVPKYVDLFREDYAQLLTIRPGITDLASLEFRDESDILAHSDDPERDYIRTILPKKISISRTYLEHLSLRHDLRIIGRTIWKVFR